MQPPVSSPFVKAISVQEADIDAQGHVSNVKILEWANDAAIAHSTALGYDVAKYMQIGGIFVVRRHEIDYHAPAFLGDELRLFTWPSTLERLRCERRHQIRRVSDEALIAQVLNLWVYVDAENGRPKRIPPEVREAFDPKNFV